MKHLTYAELQRWQAENRDFQLIDVREADEHAAFSIGGELRPLNALLRQPGGLRTDVPVVLYCKRGIRSQLAIQRLRARFPDVNFYNLQNGVLHLMYG